MKVSLNALVALQDTISTFAGYEVTLAGGCVRDAIYGRTCKDYDAIMCGVVDYQEAFDTVKNISRKLSMSGIRSEVYQAYGQNTGHTVSPGSFQETYLACIKCYPAFGDVDILLSKAPDMDAHIMLHDCNMNMVYLDASNPLGYSGVQQPVKSLAFRPGICKERQDYILNKCGAYL